MESFLDSQHFIATSNGTSAIDCVVDSLDLSPKSEAIVPSMTIISAVSNLIRSGIPIVVSDVQENTYMPSPTQMLDLVNKKTKVIIPTHIYGLLFEMEALISGIQDKKITIIEDAAESFGTTFSDGKQAGSLGSVGVFSFYANKNITGGEGGGITTNNADLADKIRELRNLGFSNTGERFITTKIGWNARISGLSAALVLSQSERVAEVILRKKQIGSRYKQNLNGHPWIVTQEDFYNNVENSYWVFAIVLNDESRLNAVELRDLLLSENIESRRFFYPLHLQPALVRSGLLRKSPAPLVAEKLWERGLYLPSGPGTLDSEIDIVCEVLWKIAKS
jgi:perosamine synthetase